VTFGIVDLLKTGELADEVPAGRSFPYPFANDWRKGCWVARPTGKADRDFAYAREFLTGSPHRGSGMVRYTLGDLGGPGWIVACDKRGVRSLILVRDVEYIDYGEVTPKDVLRVVRADSWEGRRCPACSVGVVLEGDEGGLCVNRRCESDRAESEADKAAAVAAAAAAAAARDAMPDVEPF
jgi:hypothetical protein